MLKLDHIGILKSIAFESCHEKCLELARNGTEGNNPINIKTHMRDHTFYITIPTSGRLHFIERKTLNSEISVACDSD